MSEQNKITIQELKRQAQTVTSSATYEKVKDLYSTVAGNTITMPSYLEKNFPELWKDIQAEKLENRIESDYNEPKQDPVVDHIEQDPYELEFYESEKMQLEKAGFEILDDEDKPTAAIYTVNDEAVTIIKVSDVKFKIFNGKDYNVSALIDESIREAIRVQQFLNKSNTKTSNTMAKNSVSLSGQKEKIFNAFNKVRGFMADGYPTKDIKPQKNSAGEMVTGKEAAQLFYTRKFSSLKSKISDGNAKQDEEAIKALRAWGNRSYEQQDSTAFDTLMEVFRSYTSGEGRGARAPKVKPTSKVTLDL